jgi:serine/threonine-protein kinase
VDSVGVDIALSPDGKWMVYVGAAPGGGTRLLRRDLDRLDAVAVPGSDGAAAPVVSPDGRSIAFMANGAIHTLPAEGGQPVMLASSGHRPAWSGDGLIYFSQGSLAYRVSARGGEPIAVTTAAPNIVQMSPDALPEGRGLLLTLVSGTAAQAVSRWSVPAAGPRARSSPARWPAM